MPPEPTGPTRGERIAQYEVQERLGAGGMGVVYKALDTRLGRPVALKFLPAEISGDPGAKRRFLLEAQAASRLDHPNIGTVYEIGEIADGRLFIALAFYAGESLRDRLARASLPLAAALDIAVQTARGLARAHEHGIVHRDIKPGNLLLTERGEVRIVDFGLAKLAGEASRLTRSGFTLGTPAYMSPEQAEGEEVDARTDLWSLGVVLYEMLTGRHPFPAEREAAILNAILHREPIPPSRLRPDLPPEVDRVCARFLAKRRDARIRTAADAIAVLEAVARGESLVETQVAGAAREDRPASSPTLTLRKRSLALAGLAVLLAVLAAAGVYWLWPREIRNVAVLPFDNLTGDPGRDYLAEGLSTLLAQELGAAPGLNVIGRSETARYRDSAKTGRQIAAELGVDAVLDGQLLAVAPEVFGVEASLVDGRRGFLVWTGGLQGSLEDLYGSSEPLARDLLAKLARDEAGEPGDESAEAADPSVSPRAYDLYLRGLELLEEVDNPQGPELAAALLREAVAMEPGFAAARAALATALLDQHNRTRAPEILRQAESEARSALETNPLLPASHIALAEVYRRSGRAADAVAQLRRLVALHPGSDAGYVKLALALESSGDLAGAETSLRQAVRIRPEYWRYRNELGRLLVERGDLSSARQAFEEAVELAHGEVSWPLQDLVSLEILQGDWAAAIRAYERMPQPITDAELASNIGTAYFYAGRLEEAEEYYRLAVRLAPRTFTFQGNLGDVLAKQGRVSEAVSAYSHAAELAAAELAVNPENDVTRRFQILYLAKAGECPRALRQVAAVEQDLAPTAPNAYELSKVYAVCGERDRALGLLETAVERGMEPALAAQEEEFGGLRQDPRFRRLVGRGPGG